MKPIAILFGTDDFLLEQGKHRFFADCRRRSGSDCDIQTFSKEAAPASVVEALEATSLFTSGGITVWQDCPFLPIKRGGRSRSKLSKEEQWFLDALGKLSDDKGLLFYTKGTLDKNCAFFKALRNIADSIEAAPVTDKTIMPYVASFLDRRGKSLSRQAEQYLAGLFQTWNEIPLLYVFSELDKLCIMLDSKTRRIDAGDLTDLFAGTMEKNLFTFMDYFLRRDGRHTLPFIEGLFSRQDMFLKNTGYMVSRLRLLLAYKELKQAHMSQRQCETIMTQINKGRSVKYVVYHLQKVASYWTIDELYDIITGIFSLQRNIRRGTATIRDIAPLICLYCHSESRVYD